jgi:hypothetical protein
MQNEAGAEEYCASYSSKQDKPDMKFVDSVFSKKLAQMQLNGIVSYQHELKAAATAVFAAQEIGAVQACYTLLNLDIVTTSRSVVMLIHYIDPESSKR